MHCPLAHRYNNLTVGLRTNQQRHPFELLYVSGGNVPGASVVPLPVFVQGIDLHSPPSVRHGGYWPHRSSRHPSPRRYPSLLRAGSSGGGGGGSGSGEARVYHGSKGLAARRGDQSHREPSARGLRYPSLHPGAQPPSLPFAPQSSLALPLPPPAAVTTTDPPSCNPTLSAFLFLFQQVRTGCPSRGYGGRRVQCTVPLPPNTLPERLTSAISRGMSRRGEPA